MTDLWMNPRQRPHRVRPNSQLEQDLEVLRLRHLPVSPKHLADKVGTEWQLPKGWDWPQVRAYQRVQACLMERASKRTQ
ncbi:MAG: hypothetical protein CMP86_15400 [Gammaproteobacteria bacterium]|nr:hypothetical protein [Gammaproteobacteria bacterium]